MLFHSTVRYALNPYLVHFKSVKKMKEASLEELEAVIPKNTAAKLYEVLHKE